MSWVDWLSCECIDCMQVTGTLSAALTSVGAGGTIIVQWGYAPSLCLACWSFYQPGLLQDIAITCHAKPLALQPSM